MPRWKAEMSVGPKGLDRQERRDGSQRGVIV